MHNKPPCNCRQCYFNRCKVKSVGMGTVSEHCPDKCCRAGKLKYLMFCLVSVLDFSESVLSPWSPRALQCNIKILVCYTDGFTINLVIASILLWKAQAQARTKIHFKAQVIDLWKFLIWAFSYHSEVTRHFSIHSSWARGLQQVTGALSAAAHMVVRIQELMDL